MDLNLTEEIKLLTVFVCLVGSLVPRCASSSQWKHNAKSSKQGHGYGKGDNSEERATWQDEPSWKMAPSTVILTQVIFRHGDRSATHTYPNDPHKNDWKDGLGQLSKVGMMQGYELGRFLRHRYSHLIRKTFDKDEVYIRSTNYERTLMTAESLCAGLFPVNKSQDLPVNWPFGTWQPVPIQTVSKEDEKLLHPAGTCDYVQVLQAGILAMDVSTDHIINNKELMYKLSYNTGMDIDVNSLHDLADTVFCQLQHNMSQPAWLTSDIQEKLLHYRQHRPHTVPTDVKYLSGILLDRITNNMRMKARNSSDTHKMYLYSAHDSTVGPLMSVLGVDNFLQVPYAAAFIVELHLIDGKHFVKLLYRNSSSHPPWILVADRCQLELCPLRVFAGMHQDYIVSDDEWEEVCPDPQDEARLFENNIFPILLAVIVVLLGCNIFFCYKAYSYKLQTRQGSHQEQYKLVRSAADDSDNEEDIEHTHDNGNMRRSNGVLNEYRDEEDSV